MMAALFEEGESEEEEEEGGREGWVLMPPLCWGVGWIHGYHMTR